MMFKVLILISLSVVLSSAVLVDPSEAKIIVILGPSTNQSCSLPDVNCILQQLTYTETHLYIHGFNEGPGNDSVKTIVDAYQNTQINLFVLDWSKFVTSTDTTFVADYVAADLNLINLAPYIAASIAAFLADGRLPQNKFHIVGHSLGGQLSGAVGRSFYQQTGLKIYRITGLDPAAPAFLPVTLPYVETLSSGDAQCVEIIHTDIPNYGSAAPTGDADFYPNCGLQGQPGCPSGVIVPYSADDLCSHQRSWRFYAESVKYTDEPKFWSFPAVSCQLFLSLGIGGLQSQAVVMGTACANGARGTYYLKTNAASRYAKGLYGY